MESNELTVVIVTFKSEEKIFSCINSIPSEIRVIVVENSNNITFKEEIEKKYSNVQCILSGDNKGYAVANNIGLKNVETKFALVLNPDTTLNKDSISSFFKSINEIQDFWLIGPSNHQYLNYDFKNDQMLEVENLKGFAIFFNLKKFNKEFFDENFFLFFEEIDLCKTVRKKGGKIFVHKNLLINHEGSSSVRKNKRLELEKNRNWHWMWSTFYFHKKYRGFLIALLIILPSFLSSIIRIIFYQILFNKEKRDIYFCRMSGIINSVAGRKSWYRPSLD